MRWSQRALLGGFICLFSPALLSCAQNDVSVQKIPVTVEKIYEDNPTGENGVEAHTDWFFHCEPAFDYAIIQNTQTGKGTFVQLQLKRIQLKTSLPIKIVLSKNSTPFVLQHEDGHVRICKRIYETADDVAQKSAHKLIGAVFVATRPTHEAAQSAALDAASKVLCADYSKATAVYCNRISEIYDVLSHKSPSKPVGELVDNAFKIGDQGS